MREVNAFWEKRNLGVETVELQIEESDRIDKCRERLKEIKTKYQIVKIPAGMVCMQKMLQEMGFYYIEGLIRLKHNLKNDAMSALQKRIAKSVSYSRMDEQDIKQLYDEIDNGMFTTDRIILDDFFTEKQAHDRYKNWIADELNGSGEAYKFIYKEETIGFCVHRVKQEASYGVLGGIYPKYLNSGLGFISLYISIRIEQERNASCLIADVSTNNLASLRSEISMGFQVMDVKNVFIKHM